MRHEESAEWTAERLFGLRQSRPKRHESASRKRRRTARIPPPRAPASCAYLPGRGVGNATVARELSWACADVKLAEEFASIAACRTKAIKRDGLLCEISGWFWSGA